MTEDIMDKNWRQLVDLYHAEQEKNKSLKSFIQGVINGLRDSMPETAAQIERSLLEWEYPALKGRDGG